MSTKERGKQYKQTNTQKRTTHTHELETTYTYRYHCLAYIHITVHKLNDSTEDYSGNEEIYINGQIVSF